MSITEEYVAKCCHSKDFGSVTSLTLWRQASKDGVQQEKILTVRRAFRSFQGGKTIREINRCLLLFIQDLDGLQKLNLASLDDLVVVYHEIVDVRPPHIAGLTRLTSLNLSHNVIVDFPITALAQLPLLQMVNLNDNRIRSIPPNMQSLSALRVLKLARNRIAQVPLHSMVPCGMILLIDRNVRSPAIRHQSSLASERPECTGTTRQPLRQHCSVSTGQCVILVASNRCSTCGLTTHPRNCSTRCFSCRVCSI